MNLKLRFVLALIIAGIFSIASLYVWQRANKAPIGPELARDAAIDFVLETHPDLRDLEVPSTWETQDLNPERIPGISKLQYISDGWTINVTSPVVLDPAYTIEIDCTIEEGFYWEGTVDKDENVEENTYARAR